MDDESESSDLSDGDVDDEEEIDETKPPEGVQQELFDFVLNLRA